jgi:hypothetical protein
VVSTGTSYTFTVTENVTIVANFYALDFDTYAATIWNNTFILNLILLEEEGYRVTDCKWLKSGRVEAETHSYDAFSYSAGPKKTDQLEPAPSWYMFRLTLDNGSWLYSTKKVIPYLELMPEDPANGLTIYPNPAFSGTQFTVEGVTAGNTVYVYNQFGVCVSASRASANAITLTLDLPVGFYLVRSEDKSGKIVIVK